MFFNRCFAVLDCTVLKARWRYIAQVVTPVSITGQFDRICESLERDKARFNSQDQG